MTTAHERNGESAERMEGKGEGIRMRARGREGGRDRQSQQERKRGRTERADDVMQIARLYGPSGISLPLTDVRHLSGIKRYQQEDFLLRAAERV